MDATLTSEHNASATAFAQPALAAIVACDLEALRAAMTTYVHNVHGVTLEHYLGHWNELTDAFVDGRYQDEIDTDDDRFNQLGLAALNPQDGTFTSRQLAIAKLLGEFVCGVEPATDEHNPAWELTVLGLMDTLEFVRYDLIVEFLHEKSGSNHDGILQTEHRTRRSLYTKLLVTIRRARAEL